MGALKSSRLYLSGPIEYEDESKPDWRPPVIKVLTDRFGIDVHDPSTDEKQGRAPLLVKALEEERYEDAEKVARIFVKKDFTVIAHSHFLIAYAPRGVVTTGTPCEVHYAVNDKKPVMVVCPEGKKYAPRWYFGNIRHQYIYGSWDECYDYLQEVDDRKHTDNHRWWFVYDMI